ncbi:MAG: hypothetical protein ABEH81_09455 [Halopenitus sp.]
MTWTELFERAADLDVDESDVRDALATRRAADERLTADGQPVEPSRWRSGVESTPSEEPESVAGEEAGRPEPSPGRVVADADVLAADLLVGGAAREALDELRRHSWTTLVASDALLDDAAAVMTTLSGASLASDWYATVVDWREPVEHPPEDHPALASAYQGGAMHVLSFDEQLTSAAAGTTLKGRVELSVRTPRAFAMVFDAQRLYPTVVDGEYPGPDRDPRW